MRPFTLRFAVALLTFLIGISVTTFWLIGRNRSDMNMKVPAAGEKPALPLATASVDQSVQSEELPETKAVRLAEEFIARNGYTDLPAERDQLSPEGIEWGN